MQRGQLLSQPFTIIFALVVITLTLFFGYRAISGLLNAGEDVCLVKFQKDLQNKIQDISTQPPGSNTKIAISTCTGMKGVCFINFAKPLQPEKIPYTDVRQTAQALADVGAKDNIFIASSTNKIFEHTSIAKLQVATTFCDSTLDGKLDALIENKGKFVDAISSK